MGYNCVLAYNINRFYKNLESYLFNWCFINDYDKFIECLNNNCEDIFIDGYEYNNRANMFKSIKYGISFHGKHGVDEIKDSNGNIPKETIDNEFRDLLERNKHLNDKFNSLKSSKEKKLFVHVLNPDTKTDACCFVKKMHDYLEKNYKNFTLLVIGLKNSEFLENKRKLTKKNLHFEFVNFLPPVSEAINEEKTDIQSFDSIFKKYPIKIKNIKPKNKVYKFEKSKN